MTEDEAKTKWCPFVRYIPEGIAPIAGNRRGDWGYSSDPSRCIASACMMWVTTEGHNKQGDCGLKRGG